MKRDDGQLLQPTKWRGSPSEGAADGSLPSEYCLMSHRKGAVLNNSLHFSSYSTDSDSCLYLLHLLYVITYVFYGDAKPFSTNSRTCKTEMWRGNIETT